MPQIQIERPTGQTRPIILRLPIMASQILPLGWSPVQKAPSCVLWRSLEPQNWSIDVSGRAYGWLWKATVSSLAHSWASMISSVSACSSCMLLPSESIDIPINTYRHGVRGCDWVVRLHVLCLFFSRILKLPRHSSETTPQGKKTTKLAQTLLNGNNICLACLPAFIPSGRWANANDLFCSWYLVAQVPRKHEVRVLWISAEHLMVPTWLSCKPLYPEMNRRSASTVSHHAKRYYWSFAECDNYKYMVDGASSQDSISKVIKSRQNPAW
jgi:hypothetical protein